MRESYSQDGRKKELQPNKATLSTFDVDGRIGILTTLDHVAQFSYKVFVLHGLVHVLNRQACHILWIIVIDKKLLATQNKTLCAIHDAQIALIEDIVDMDVRSPSTL